MKTKQLLKLLPIAATLATLAVPAQAANWGAWSNNTNLRSAQFRQSLQNMTMQANTQMVNAAYNAPQAATAPAANATTNTLPSTNVQLSNATTLLSVTSGQTLNPATGLPAGAIGGATVPDGAILAALLSNGGAGGGSTAATITLPNDMIWPGFAGVSAAELASGRITMFCPDPFFCDVKNPASTLINNGSDVASQQAWGIWKGTPGATYAIYLKQTPGQATMNFNVNAPESVFAYAFGPAMTGTLPASGTFNYTYLGGVIVNSTTGATGTVNSAALTVNFTAATVQHSLNATIAGTTYAVNTTANGNVSFPTAIQSTCTPACNSTVSAYFTGAAGAGAIVTNTIGQVMAQTVFKR